jgi:hypothetical protein
MILLLRQYGNQMDQIKGIVDDDEEEIDRKRNRAKNRKKNNRNLKGKNIWHDEKNEKKLRKLMQKYYQYMNGRKSIL